MGSGSAEVWRSKGPLGKKNKPVREKGSRKSRSWRWGAVGEEPERGGGRGALVGGGTDEESACAEQSWRRRWLLYPVLLNATTWWKYFAVGRH